MAAVTFPKFPKQEKTGVPGFPEIPAPPLGGGNFREGMIPETTFRGIACETD